MGRPRNAVMKELRNLAAQLEDWVDDCRNEAGFMALEALETDNQDARECRERALCMSARSTAFAEVLSMVRDRINGHCGCGEKPIASWTCTADIKKASEL